MDPKKVELSLVSLSLLGGSMWAGRVMMEKSRELNANICVNFSHSACKHTGLLVNVLPRSMVFLFQESSSGLGRNG